MRQGSRDADLIHHLNQRYRYEFDRAEQLKAELADIQGSRIWPWFCRLRRWATWGKSLFRSQPVEPDASRRDRTTSPNTTVPFIATG